MTFKSNVFTFGSKNDAGISAIPITVTNPVTTYFPGMSVYNNRIAKPEYLFGFPMGGNYTELVWGSEDCVLCKTSDSTIVEGNVVSLVSFPASPNPYNPPVEKTASNDGRVVGVVRRANSTTGSVMVATEGLYNVKVAPSVSGNIDRGSKVIVSATTPGTVEIISATTPGKIVGVVGKYYAAGSYSSGLIQCYIQINFY